MLTFAASRILSESVPAGMFEPSSRVSGLSVLSRNVTQGTPRMQVSSCTPQGNVKLVRASWNRDLFEEFELFPTGAHDDIVDAASGAFDKLTESAPLGGSGAPKWIGG